MFLLLIKLFKKRILKFPTKNGNKNKKRIIKKE